ncbi:putative polyketide synthase [Apodospora peruviana]|uniref:Polyketide synthase n=1 Tax=Apodospora peruviana TaxID=516989 RepID=A0AAE0IH14_9PEZI|nr:putative polyketide synthase [Apodospora peruviana]
MAGSYHNTSQHASQQRVFVFGSQALSLDAAALQSLHVSVMRMRNNEWLLNTIASLPRCWESFVSRFPKYTLESGVSLLQRLDQWSKTGSLDLSVPLPNILVSPLVVITHLVEYLEHVSNDDVGSGKQFLESLGFCTGILSAAAVSLSEDRNQLESYGSIAIRLAMVIGGVVDSQDVVDGTGPSKSLAIAWTSFESSKQLDKILAKYPEAYISVSFDERRATITTSATTATALQEELRNARVVVNEIGLRGRFHSPTLYKDDMEDLIRYFDSEPTLCLPDASGLTSRMRSNSGDGSFLTTGPIHAHALKAILVEHCDWYGTFKAMCSSIPTGRQPVVTTFGPARCIPPSLAKEIDSSQTTKTRIPEPRHEDIAVIGMSIKVAGADDVSEFWDLLCDGSSQHKEVPSEQVSFDTVWREKDDSRKWFGNFINDPDVFDQKFFKKSAREAASMDPQQRQMLQAAYQALEQAGYLNTPEQDRNKNVGCYIGVCSADYENNVACHQPNAFTAIGNLKSFIAGKISHYFGWTSSAMCIDTACSSSLVAVHLACKSILSGECDAALAGGVNVMTNALWFQNLAAASFLSPTGQCKPFDVSADGYCRGEGIAAVVLKRMSTAIADGDQILGTIPSTAVYQNQNCTPIFVPNAPSLSDLFRRVMSESGLEPSQVSYVEAHGTGTQVGDPAEYDSIRQVLGGSHRPGSKPLALGSVKGLVGHTECTSGGVSLIKTILMVQNKVLPAQQSFSTVNPHLNMLADDNIEINTKTRPWDTEYRAALINNYGASGSNASMTVAQAPRLTLTNSKTGTTRPSSATGEFPIRLCGKDVRALKEYAAKLRQFLVSSSRAGDDLSVANVAFNLCRQSNPSLEQAWIVSCRSKDQLLDRLGAFAAGDIEAGRVVQRAATRPAILCFGGQISTSVGLSREVYDNATVLRGWLNQCDDVCRSIGCESIFPGIFEKEPISDPVKLQTMLFAMQYSCAMSWIDCGVQPVAVVGHSFGELVSLCISGVLSLHDAIKMIAGRAKIIKNSWGSEKGSMVAVEADLAQAESLLVEAAVVCNESGEVPPTIACFNGPRSFTIAGSSKAIDLTIQIMTQNAKFAAMRFKRLTVTNAFHSTLVEPLMEQLEEVGRGLTFNKPTLDLERATEFQSSDHLTARYVADHMRNPVHFSHAVRRLSKKYPAAIWLEAGSNSTITNMAARAVGPDSAKGHSFQPVNITNDNGLQFLTNTTMNLWGEGLTTLTYWMHHRTQTYDYTPLMLPAYQFEKSRHWMEAKAPPTREVATIQAAQTTTPVGLWTFAGYTDTEKRSARFRVNTATDEYLGFVSGHIIAGEAAICPATLQVNMAVEALISLVPDFGSSSLQPKICYVENQSPVCVDPSRQVWLEVHANDASLHDWDWKMLSEGPNGKATTTHVIGKVVFFAADDAEWRHEFSRYERLVGHQRCLSLLQSDDADDIIQGRHIYKAFSEVVDYADSYHGLQKLVGKGTESAGKVVKRHQGKTWLDTHLSDCFSQVGGIWVNCMTDKKPGDMYIATGFEKWIRSPDFDGARYGQLEKWDVFGTHYADSEHSWLTDIFIFDPISQGLVEVILGIKYHGVAKASMRKILSRLTPGSGQPAPAAPVSDESEPTMPGMKKTETVTAAKQQKEKPSAKPKKDKSAGNVVSDKIRALLAEISGLEPEDIKPDSQLADIGIDSLMGMELARELEQLFKCTLPSDELMSIVDFGQLVRLVQNTLGVTADDSGIDTADGDDTSEDSLSTSGQVTPVPPHTGASTAKMVELADEKLASAGDLELPPSTIIEAFEESKRLTDQFIADYRCAGYMDEVLPRQTQLCVALTVEAFEQLGCNLRAAKTGQILTRIEHIPEQRLLANYLYEMLEKEARIIDMDNGVITRTAVSIPYKPSDVILSQLLKDLPDHEWANRLTFFAGSRLADVLSGKCDGIKLIFGSDEGRELVTGLYGDSLLNKLANVQMQDIITRLAAKLPKDQGPLKIMELGAGTGGTTKGMAALLSKLGIPVEYTFTDLSGSFVAAARKAFKEYPFMRFRVHNIEHAPADDLVGTQHVIIASNAIHATHNLVSSASNIRKALRPDGFLMMLEMTQPLFWVDIIFGLFEGWWLFDDGRKHAIAHQTVWERDLQTAGYGHVDWTDGYRPEIEVQRVIVALASGPRYGRQPLPPPPAKALQPAPSTAARRAVIDEYIATHTRGFTAPTSSHGQVPSPQGQTVLITGASGSLGTHLVAHMAALPHVSSVICLNRRSVSATPEARQHRAMEERGILLDAACHSKLQVFQTDTSKPMLGLSASEYESLANSVTHIIHNAWPMSGKRPLSAMESQLTVMRNLVDFAREIACRRPAPFRVSFQFISSIAVIGHYPLPEGNRFVPEERMDIDSVLPNGYGEAKFICERILDETLHKHGADRYRAMSVRLGQIAGSRVTGYWNPMEHFSFLIKSSQTLRAFPKFEGDLCWTPVEDVAGTLSDLVLSDRKACYPVYHIDNPVRQPWGEMVPVLIKELGIPDGNVIPFEAWVRRVRQFPGATDGDNPAARLVDFLDGNFLRMSCGGLLLGTEKSCEHSKTLAGLGPVSESVARKYIQAWKDMGFLHK